MMRARTIIVRGGTKPGELEKRREEAWSTGHTEQASEVAAAEGSVPSYTGKRTLGVEGGGPPGVVRMKSIAKCNAATLSDIAAGGRDGRGVGGLLLIVDSDFKLQR